MAESRAIKPRIPEGVMPENSGMDNPKALSVLFCGLGSIGTRHLTNLAELCEERDIRLSVAALRSGSRPLPEAAARRVDEEFGHLPEGAHWDLAFITAPTHRHAELLRLLKGRAGALFIEKPIFESAGYDLAELGLAELGLTELDSADGNAQGAQNAQTAQKAYVAAPVRHTALYAALREKLKSVKPYSARVICSSYLPGWRPGADYRQGYSAQKAMGGGVTLDLIHEWDYLYDLFGAPSAVCNYSGRYSHLEIDADDLSVYIAEYPSMLCEVHLDYFGRGYRREIELLCEEGTLRADFGSGTLYLPGGGSEDYSEDANRRYQREMAWFLDYAMGAATENLNSPARALQVLKIALGKEGTSQ